MRPPAIGRPWPGQVDGGWDGTGRLSLNEWWDDLVAPTRGVLVARILMVCVGLGLLVEGGALVLPVSLLLWVMAATVRPRGQAPRRKPYVAPLSWRPPVDWTFESGDHAVELLAPGGTGDRANTAAVRLLEAAGARARVVPPDAGATGP